MRILEYDEVDPWHVLRFNLLSLGFPLTPERAAHIRTTDPRPLPCLTVNVVEEDTLVGQAGIYRLPMISKEGREDVGGLWALAIHAQLGGGGVSSLLLEEAHARMRAAGFRFSTLAARRHHRMYDLALQHGYEEMNVCATALGHWETAHQPTRLRAEPLGTEGYDFVEQVFTSIANEYTGFAWRHTPFSGLRQIDKSDIWILLEYKRCVGYLISNSNATMLRVRNLVLRQGVDPAEAIAAVVAKQKSDYVQVELSRPIELNSLRRTGYSVIYPTMSDFLVKSLVPAVTNDDARHLFGIGTDRFLISWLDVTGEPLST